MEAILFIVWLMMMMMQVDHVVCAAGADVRCIEREKQALLDLKAGLVDDYGMLSSWEDNLDCCHWKGVGCSNLTGHVLKLSLSDARLVLRGKISTSLVELQHLRYLDLNSNDFEGIHIPEFFGSVINLRYLNLAACSFNGKIPSQLGFLSQLKYLILFGNSLEGSIPFQLGNLSKLGYLDLGWNSLEGTIPSQLGNLSSLHKLYLGSLDDGALKIDDGNEGGGQWLSSLTSLTHLDLSHVLNLNISHNWLQKIGNMSELSELSLSSCSHSDHFILSMWPSKFKFSDSLISLDLSSNTFTSSLIFQWVSNVTSNLVELYLYGNNLSEGSVSNHFSMTMNSLEQLELGNNRLKGADVKSFINICTLRYLSFIQNNLTEDLPSILRDLCAGCVRYSLRELRLDGNQITGTLPDLSIFSSLKSLALSSNRLEGKIPENILLPPQLVSLYIMSNSLRGGIPKSFGNTCTLTFLDMSRNNLSEELPVIIHHLSGCARYSLQELNLENNQINGTLPDLSIFQSLEVLFLSENKIDGKILEDIQFPYQLVALEMKSNSLQGMITDYQFANMSKLKILDLSNNSIGLTFSHNWVPSFQLEEVQLRGCMLGPSFPRWLQTQIKLIDLDISNTGISDAVPGWFWALSTNLKLMNISYNNLTGVIPNFPLRLVEYPIISLAMNQFEGSIPPFLRRANFLDMSNNKFSDFALFVCATGTTEGLCQLDISNNHLFGQVPDCWSNFRSLAYMDLSNNILFGPIPTSTGLALELRALVLRNNNLTGELPLSLRSCTNLVMLDVGRNNLAGVIPSWIGSSLQQLQMLSLRRNHFFGGLPSSLCYLTSINLLDLSSNNLNGQIPKCFNNFTAMTQEGLSKIYDHFYTINLPGDDYTNYYDLFALLMWKGVEHIIKNNKLLLKGIDLSNNQFSEDIPAELGNLIELVSLNLSRNNLKGKIPWEIGKLVSLEFLDLSRNHLFGSIPSSLVQIDRLSMLDLSRNNLSGKIPTGTQLQSFNASSYEENQDLCGPPLEKMCLEEQSPPGSSVRTQEGRDLFFETFYMSMGLGFFVGFWGIFGTILFNRSWRHAYFRFLNNLTNKILSMWRWSILVQNATIARKLPLCYRNSKTYLPILKANKGGLEKEEKLDGDAALTNFSPGNISRCMQTKIHDKQSMRK